MPGPPRNPAMEARLTMVPPFGIRAAASRTTAKCARTLTSSIRATKSSAASTMGPVVGKIPALLTTMSRPPSPAAWSNAAVSCVWSVMSHCTPVAPSPTAVDSTSAARSPIVTVAPASTSRVTIAAPMPWAPPVTNARRPSRLIRSGSEAMITRSYDASLVRLGPARRAGASAHGSGERQVEISTPKSC